MSLVFAQGLGFLMNTMVWCPRPLGHPGSGQNEDQCSGALPKSLCSSARGLDVKVSGVSGLGKKFAMTSPVTPWV